MPFRSLSLVRLEELPGPLVFVHSPGINTSESPFGKLSPEADKKAHLQANNTQQRSRVDERVRWVWSWPAGRLSDGIHFWPRLLCRFINCLAGACVTKLASSPVGTTRTSRACFFDPQDTDGGPDQASFTTAQVSGKPYVNNVALSRRSLNGTITQQGSTGCIEAWGRASLRARAPPEADHLTPISLGTFGNRADPTSQIETRVPKLLGRTVILHSAEEDVSIA